MDDDAGARMPQGDRPSRSKACSDSVDHDMAASSTTEPLGFGSFDARPFGRTGNRGRQIRRALQALLNPTSHAISSPLCLVTSDGRSPLLHEVAAWATAWGLTVFFRDGGQFGAEIHKAVTENRWERLRERVTAADLVVIEHVEAIGSLPQLSGFRHLFDAATFGETRFCLSLADHPAMGHLPPDLAGRLAGGLVIPLTHREPVSASAGGAVTRPSAVAGLQSPSWPPLQPSLERIFAATARHYGLTVETLVGPSRSRTVCHARSLAMYLARHLTDRSFSSIGRACGNRDHTTVLHGMRATSARIDADPVIAADAMAICETLERRTSRKRPRPPRSPTLSMERR